MDPALLPGDYLIETAERRRDGRSRIFCVRSCLGPERLPFAAGVFTKGCVGVQPRGKERLDNLENSDRDNRRKGSFPGNDKEKR